MQDEENAIEEKCLELIAAYGMVDLLNGLNRAVATKLAAHQRDLVFTAENESTGDRILRQARLYKSWLDTARAVNEAYTVAAKTFREYTILSRFRP